MLTLQQIKENPDRVVERLAVKGFDGKEPISRVLELDEDRRKLQMQYDVMAQELKKLAASIGALMKQGNKEEAENAKARVAAIKEEQKAIDTKLGETERAQREVLLSIPNLPCDMVPAGTSAEDNVVEKPEVPCRNSVLTRSLTGISPRNITSLTSNSATRLPEPDSLYISAKAPACSVP